MTWVRLWVRPMPMWWSWPCTRRGDGSPSRSWPRSHLPDAREPHRTPPSRRPRLPQPRQLGLRMLLIGGGWLTPPQVGRAAFASRSRQSSRVVLVGFAVRGCRRCDPFCPRGPGPRTSRGYTWCPLLPRCVAARGSWLVAQVRNAPIEPCADRPDTRYIPLSPHCWHTTAQYAERAA